MNSQEKYTIILYKYNGDINVISISGEKIKVSVCVGKYWVKISSASEISNFLASECRYRSGTVNSKSFLSKVLI